MFDEKFVQRFGVDCDTPHWIDPKDHLLVIVFDGETGICVPDKKSEDVARQIVDTHKLSANGIRVFISSEVLFYQFRVLAVRGVLDHNEVRIHYTQEQDRVAYMSMYGRIDDWFGAPSVIDDAIEEILMSSSKKVKGE